VVLASQVVKPAMNSTASVY